MPGAGIVVLAVVTAAWVLSNRAGYLPAGRGIDREGAGSMVEPSAKASDPVARAGRSRRGQAGDAQNPIAPPAGDEVWNVIDPEITSALHFPVGGLESEPDSENAPPFIGGHQDVLARPGASLGR